MMKLYIFIGFIAISNCFKYSRFPASKLTELKSTNWDICLNSIDAYEIYKFGVAGALAGGCRAISRGLTFPLDTIKTIAQAKSSASSSSRPSITLPATTDATRSPRSFSFKQYFQGVTISVISAIPANSVFFIVYNSLEKLTPCINGGIYNLGYDLLERIITSAIATLPQNAIKIPAEVIKQRAQTSGNKSTSEIFKEIVSSPQGWKGLFQGGNAQLLREIPYNSIQMSTYALLQDLDRDSKWISHFSQLSSSEVAGVLGILAAAVAAILTHPVDVIKTSLMTEDTDDRKASSATVLSVARSILSEQGVSGFLVGLKERLLLVSIGGGIYFWSTALAETYLDMQGQVR